MTENSLVNEKSILSNYPDVLNVEQVREILGIGRNLAYQLLLTKQISAKKLGHNWIIAKSNLIKFILSEDNNARNGNV